MEYEKSNDPSEDQRAIDEAVLDALEDDSEEEPTLQRPMKRIIESSSSGLDDDDLDLIDQNLGINKKRTFTKLRKKDEEDDEPKRVVRDLEDIFSQDDGEHDDMDVDEMDHFIASEDDDHIERPPQAIKKKRTADTPKQSSDMGISEDAWRDIQDIFGDGTDYDWALQLQAEHTHSIEHQEGAAFNLEEVFEPSVIQSRMMTTADEEMRVTDQPERLQLAGIKGMSVPQMTSTSLYVAGKLGVKRDRRELLGLDPDAIEKTLLYKAIWHVLNFIHKENLEVPFIILHRKDYITPILKPSEVWDVYAFDLEYSALLKRLGLLKQFYADICADKEGKDDYVDKMLRSQTILSSERLHDVHQYLAQTYPDHVKNKHRRSSSLATLAANSKMPAGLEQDYGELFCFTTEQFIDTITHDKRISFPPSSIVNPLEIAYRYSDKDTTAQQLLDEYRKHLSKQWSIDPNLKQTVRDKMFSHARINVRATTLGMAKIDYIHALFSVKYIRHKPIKAFKNSVSWLTLVKGEADGLLKVEIDCDWAEERKRVVTAAVNGDLHTTFQKYVRDRLYKEAIDELGERVEVSLLDKIRMCGVDTKKNICAVREDGDKLCAVICDIYGVYNQKTWIDIDNSNPERRLLAAKKLSDFINGECEYVCFGTQSVKFVKQMREIELQIGDTSRGKVQLKFVVVDDDCARIYMDSTRGKKELSYLACAERYCVSIVRKVLDPVMEYAGLVNSDNDIRLLKLHPLQSNLSEDRLNQVIDQTFIKVVFLCGVDINLAMKHPHKSSTLQYVAGLGPRKAQSILANLMSQPLIVRADLVTRQIVSAKVYHNCASFIRIRSIHFKGKKREDDLDVLDDSRINPEDYRLARQMACDTLEENDNYSPEDVDAESSNGVKILMAKGNHEKVKVLDELDLDSFSAQLDSQEGSTPKRVTLAEIKEELIAPFKEFRKRFSVMSDDDLFALLTQETSETLYVGMVTACYVERIFDKGVRVKLSSCNLDGFIALRNLSDDFNASCLDVVKVDQFINCCVIGIDKVRFSVELSSAINNVHAAIKATTEREKNKIDPSYCIRWEEEDEQAAAMAILALKKKSVKERRIIRHDLFKNMDYKDAEKYLKGRNDGDVVIRPSTKGNDHLSITWRIYNDIFLHIDVKEVVTGSKTQYHMDDKVYSQLDEVLDKAIYPTNQYIKELIASPKFYKLDIEAATKKISQECKSSKRSQYGFILSKEKPGRAVLLYKHTDSGDRQEYIGISGSGYLFREKAMKAVVDIIQYFKMDEAKKSQTADPRRQMQQPSVQQARK